MLGPILVFTSDEIWENLPADTDRPESVHLALLPDANPSSEDELLSIWQRLFEIRDDVLQSLEKARIDKQIGSSLEARVEISAAGDVYDLLVHHADDLRYLFIVSDVNVVKSDKDDAAGVAVSVLRAEGKKCERCWNYSTLVGESGKYPNVCERCVIALEEIEASNVPV